MTWIEKLKYHVGGVMPKSCNQQTAVAVVAENFCAISTVRLEKDFMTSRWHCNVSLRRSYSTSGVVDENFLCNLNRMGKKSFHDVTLALQGPIHWWAAVQRIYSTAAVFVRYFSTNLNSNSIKYFLFSVYYSRYLLYKNKKWLYPQKVFL